jgi:hypothetical protein
MKRIVLAVLAFVLANLIFADGVQPIGAGTETDPYQIATLDNLLWMSSTILGISNAYYLQTADIDASNTQSWNNGEGFRPIGDYASNIVYNGDNHTIDNLYINNLFSTAVGFFGFASNCVVLNLTLQSVDITGYYYVGSLVGDGNGTVIDNCSASGEVNGSKFVGGLAGSCGTISNSFSSVCVTATNSFPCGISDILYSTELINSYYDYESVLLNNQHVLTPGGIPTDLYNTWISNGRIINIDDYLTYDGQDYLINNIDDFEKLLLFGYYPEFSFKLCSNFDLSTSPNFYIPYFTSFLNGNNFDINGLNIDFPELENAGLFGYSSSNTIENLGVTNVNINAKSNIGSLVGFNKNSTILNCHVSGSINGQSKIGGLSGYLFDANSIVNSYSSVNVQGVGDNIGGMVGMLNDVSTNLNNSYYNYETTSINGEYQVTLGALPDELFIDWLNSGLLLNIDEYLTQSGEFHLINNVFEFKSLLAFSGNPDYMFKLTDDIDLTNEVEFFIPYLSAEFDGDNHVIYGLNTTTNNSCKGLFGVVSGSEVKNIGCISAVISGSSYVGGLIGFGNLATITNCYTSCQLNANAKVGGISGIIKDCEVTNCYSVPNITGNGTQIGGLVGWLHNSSISNSYSQGFLHGRIELGGLIGYFESGTVVNCYSNNAVYSNLNFLCGGFIGNGSEMSVTNCIWNTETANQDSGLGHSSFLPGSTLYGKTSLEMQTESTYSDLGWDFETIWNISSNINEGYPYLTDLAIPVDISEDIIPSNTEISYLNSAYPNPFNPETTIEFNVRAGEKGYLTIFNIKGQIVNDYPVFSEGEHRVIWNGTDNQDREISSGVYFYRLKTRTIDTVKKMIMMK